jgi:ribosomal protein L37AE/L43A
MTHISKILKKVFNKKHKPKKTRIINEDELYKENLIFSDFVKDEVYHCPQCNIDTDKPLHGDGFICKCGLKAIRYGNSLYIFSYSLPLYNYEANYTSLIGNPFLTKKIEESLTFHHEKGIVKKSLIIKNLSYKETNFQCISCKKTYPIKQEVNSWSCNTCLAKYKSSGTFLEYDISATYNIKRKIKGF